MTAWDDLPAFTGTIDGTDQVVCVAGTGGAKSTLVATLTLPVGSLVAIDDKGALHLPRAREIELPKYDRENPDAYLGAVTRSLAWRDGAMANRVILRPHALDVDDFDAHDLIFRAIYTRGETFLWIDEITATGATAQRAQPWLRALSSRGRTRGIGMVTCTQSPFGIMPPILRRNATYLILGSVDPQDVRDLNREGADIATTIPRKTGRFVVWTAGDRQPFRLYLPIPPALAGWRAP